MKRTKGLLLCTLAAVVFAGCSKDGRDMKSGEDMTGKAFLSIALTSNAPAPGRAANEQKPGTENESKAGKVTVLLFDEMNKCLDAVDFSGTVVGNSDGAGNAATASDAKPVPAAAKKVLVVVNPYFATPKGWDLSPATVKGKTWNEINTAMTDAVIANIATNQNFMMTNAGDAVSGALTDVTVSKPASDTQVAIDAAKAQAKANAVEIHIDRLAAKVTVSQNPVGGVTVPAGASFQFTGWEFSVVNKIVRLYSDLVSYANASAGAVYRRDNNYLVSEQPALADMKTSFSYLSNIDNAADEMPVVGKALASDAYCTENTMDAAAQQLGYTTKVVVKAKYSPAGFNLGDSYFFWNGEFFTLAQLQAKYLTHADGTGLKTDLPKFLNKAGLMADAVLNGTQAERNQVVANLAAADFNAKTGIIGRYCAVRYYHESVCYYDVLIRHDQSVTGRMALGKYGVVRNNWYGLQINSVSNPGTPWIPDPSDPDTDNPTKPDAEDDEGNAYMSVKITINPWTYWTQGVDLH